MKHVKTSDDDILKMMGKLSDDDMDKVLDMMNKLKNGQ